MSWKNVLDSNGKQIPDPRVYAWQRPNEMAITLGIIDPESCWGKAGLHTDDKIISINKKPIHSREDFWQTIRTLHRGQFVDGIGNYIWSKTNYSSSVWL
jgi:hypothetical protein